MVGLINLLPIIVPLVTLLIAAICLRRHEAISDITMSDAIELMQRRLDRLDAELRRSHRENRLLHRAVFKGLEREAALSKRLLSLSKQQSAPLP